MKRCLVISMFALLAVSGVAHGTTIAFKFRGSVTSVPSELAGQFTVGQNFTGVFGFNSEAQDLAPSPNFGQYEALGFGHVNIGANDPAPNYSAQIFGGTIGVEDNRRSGVGDTYFDTYSVNAGVTGGTCRDDSELSGPAVNGWELCSFDLRLIDFDGLALDSDRLPLAPPDLDDFAGSTCGNCSALSLIFLRGGEGHHVEVSLWPDQPGARFFIAEPGTLALLSLGLLGLGLTRRRAN